MYAVFVEGSEDQIDRLAVLPAELVRRQIAVIITNGAIPAHFAANAATTAIPTVFTA